MNVLFTKRLKISESKEGNHWIINPRFGKPWWYSLNATEKQIRLMFDVY